MSDYDDDPAEQEPNIPADLRKALKRANEELKTERERLATLEKQVREQTLAGVITKRDLDPRVAALIPLDADPAEWLETYGDLFGAKKEPPTTEQQEADKGLTAEEIEELRRQQDSERQFRVPGNEADELAKVKGAGSLNDLTALIRAAQQTT